MTQQRRPSLDTLLRAKIEGRLGSPPRKLTPAEIWDQRISFAFGQLLNSNVTREDVEARAIEMYGPRPKETNE